MGTLIYVKCYSKSKSLKKKCRTVKVNRDIRLTTTFLFSGADILAVNADQSISFDICEERSECLFYLQNEMRRAGITQKDIDKARKSQEVRLIEHCKELRFVKDEAVYKVVAWKRGLYDMFKFYAINP